MDKRIVFAIQTRQVLNILYYGQLRDFEPYVYGRLKTGQDVLFGWQNSGAYAGWRVLYLQLIERYSMTHATFEAQRSEYQHVMPTGLVDVYADCLERPCRVPMPAVAVPGSMLG